MCAFTSNITWRIEQNRIEWNRCQAGSTHSCGLSAEKAARVSSLPLPPSLSEIIACVLAWGQDVLRFYQLVWPRLISIPALANETAAHTHTGRHPFIHIYLTIYMCEYKHTHVYTDHQLTNATGFTVCFYTCGQVRTVHNTYTQ